MGDRAAHPEAERDAADGGQALPVAGADGPGEVEGERRF
jgi:hypothetical protein